MRRSPVPRPGAWATAGTGAISAKGSRGVPVGAPPASIAPPHDAQLRRGRDRAFAKSEGPVSCSQGGAPAAGDVADSHHSPWGRRDAAMGGDGESRDEGKS